MKKIILGILILTLSSCHYLGKGNGIDFEIKNNSKETITDIKIYTSEKIEVVSVEKIEPNKSISDFLSMKENKTDGEYHIEFKRKNGSTQNSKGGYYTNGVALNSWIEFDIRNDTVKYKSSGRKF